MSGLLPRTTLAFCRALHPDKFHKRDKIFVAMREGVITNRSKLHPASRPHANATLAFFNTYSLPSDCSLGSAEVWERTQRLDIFSKYTSVPECYARYSVSFTRPSGPYTENLQVWLRERRSRSATPLTDAHFIPRNSFCKKFYWRLDKTTFTCKKTRSRLARRVHVRLERSVKHHIHRQRLQRMKSLTPELILPVLSFFWQRGPQWPGVGQTIRFDA